MDPGCSIKTAGTDWGSINSILEKPGGEPGNGCHYHPYVYVYIYVYDMYMYIREAAAR